VWLAPLTPRARRVLFVSVVDDTSSSPAAVCTVLPAVAAVA
jgi:hypothetical protein